MKSTKELRKWCVSLVFFSLLAGCGARSPMGSLPERSLACQEIWQELASTLAATGAADSASTRVAQYPYLRVNRFWAGLLATCPDNTCRRAVLAQLRQLNSQGLPGELRRLGPAGGQELAQRLGVAATDIIAKARQCSMVLWQQDLTAGDFFDPNAEIGVADDYSLFLRSIGLYPLFYLPVQAAIASAHDRLAAAMTEEAQMTQPQTLFGPSLARQLSGAEVAEILASSRQPPLQVPQPTDRQMALLRQTFAPVFALSLQKPGEIFGKVGMGIGHWQVESKHPLVYFYASHTMLKQSPALQLNYVIWFVARTAPAPWFERGRLDGLTVRYTLGMNGEPVFVDVINNCGCYHVVLPNRAFVLRQGKAGASYTPLVPMALPARPGGTGRWVFHVAPGWHQLRQVQVSKASSWGRYYDFRPYDELEQLVGQQGISSLFGADGIVTGSERFERFFLFPMGIPRVGAMRQRGHQPVSLIGRAHFDDPQLFDNYFSYGSSSAALDKEAKITK